MKVNVPYVEACRKLFEAYGPVPQAVTLKGWRSVLPPNTAKFYFTYYTKDGAPSMVGSGLELAFHPMMEAIKLHLAIADKEAERRLSEAIFQTPVPPVQSEEQPQTE